MTEDLQAEPTEAETEEARVTNGHDGPWSVDELTSLEPPPPPAPGESQADEPPPPPDENVERSVRIGFDLFVVAACVLFVFLQLGPSNLFSDTTPAGGDMGAHVWGPAYLRDHLLPSYQLSGWTPDWYAGFPAYQYYMLLPPLLIVLLDLGVSGPLVVLPLAVAGGAVAMAVRTWGQRSWLRWLWVAIAVVALLCISIPYGVAFKLVSVIGPLGLPASAYAFGRLARLRYPIPALMAVFTLPFLFFRGYSIYGGNIPSTLAGEFSFAISLCLALLYLGVVFRGLETGRHRALAAGLLALTGLCHVIPVLWALLATAVIVVVRPRRSDAPLNACLLLLVPGASLVALAIWRLPPDVLQGDASLAELALLALGVGGAVMLLAGIWLVSQTVRWLAPVLVVAGMLAGFWVLPFYLRGTYMNDMGWEKVPYFTQGEQWWDYLLPSRDSFSAQNPDDLRWMFVLALLGLVLSLVLRLRGGIFLALLAAANVGVFMGLPQWRLWNARVTPFYYLAVMLLAGLAVGAAVRLFAEAIRRRPPRAYVGGISSVAGLGLVVVLVGLPLGVLPLDEPIGDEASPNGYKWPSFSPWQMETTPGSFIPGWANWNYSGYERKPSYREYYDIVQTMDGVGRDVGCGRALWEYEGELDRYGTPMALMLLPYWTDGCIGSMEGLYFESSATTPYHFLMAGELSAAPSNPQRDLPYNGLNIDLGVRHLQLMGVRYYMAFSDQAVQAASQNPALSQVAVSEPWTVFEVDDSELVTPLDHEPAVLEGVGDTQEEWLEEPQDYNRRQFGPSLQWFLDPAQWEIPWAQGGPDDWQRIALGEAPEARSVTPAEVTNIDEGDQSISFDVDRVGSPVLVKTSYFPNWEADGAEGPWRVAPNLMVVVPTDRHVELHFRWTPVEYGSYGLSLLGLVALVVLARRGAYHFRLATSSPSGAAGADEPPNGAEPAGADGAAESDAVTLLPAEGAESPDGEDGSAQPAVPPADEATPSDDGEEQDEATGGDEDDSTPHPELRPEQ